MMEERKADGRKSSIFSGITRNVLVLGIVSFLTDASTDMIVPFLPIFLTQVLGASTVFVGLVEGVAESTASFFKIFSGWLSDSIGRRKLLAVIGYGISGCTRPLVACSTAGWHVLFARFVDRVGKGMRTAPRDALLADSTESSRWGKAFGFHRSMDNLGAVVGPILASLLFIAFPGNYRAIFWFATIPAILSVLTMAFLAQERRTRIGQRTEKLSLSLKPYDLRFKLYLLILLIFTLGNSSDAFLILRARTLGISDALIPILWMTLSVVRTSFSTFGGGLSDRIGRRKVIIAGWGIYSLVYLGFAAATEAIHIWILFLVYGIYYSLVEGTEKALIADLVPSELRGTAYGLYNFAVGIGALPASLILGSLWKALGPGAAFSFGAGMAFLATALFWLAIKERGED